MSTTGFKAISLAAGSLLRGTIMGHYAAGGDHPKRLVSVEANSKFASPQTGPNEPWQVSLASGLLIMASLCSTG